MIGKKKIDLNYLEMTPKRKYGHEVRDDGKVNVLVPRFTDKVLGKYLQPKLKNKYIKANLDELGSSVWLLINGKSNVLSIIDGFRTGHEEDIPNLEGRLTKFLTHLYEAGFISFNELERK